MNRWIKAIANRCVFATSKNRVDVRKAKTSDHAALRASAVHALYSLYGQLRGLCAGRASQDATARRTERSTQSWQTWTSAMQPCLLVRRWSPALVEVA
jgi:hypothetical protein